MEEEPPRAEGPPGLEHLRGFPTLRDPRIHVVLNGKVLQSAILGMPQRTALAHAGEHRELRQHAAVEDSLRRWWEWLPRPKSWMVAWKEFRLLTAACYEELVPELVRQYSDLPAAGASVDWHAACQGERVMNNERFAESILELADNWAASNAPCDYADWLDSLLHRVQSRWGDAAQEELAAVGEGTAAKTEPGAMLPDQDSFKWPLPAPAPSPPRTNNVQRGLEALLFGKNVVSASAFGTIIAGKRRDQRLRAWDGEKYEPGIHTAAREASAGVTSVMLVPNPQTSAPTVPHRAEFPQSSSLGQAKEAIKYCSESLQESSSMSAAQMHIELQMDALYCDKSSTRLASHSRPYSSQHPRSKDGGAEQDRTRPASSHAPLRDKRPVSAVRKRQVGGGGFVTDLRKEYERTCEAELTNTVRSTAIRHHSALRPQSALIVPQRPHSALHLHSSQIMGSPSEIYEHEPPQRHRPSTSLGYRSKPSVETRLTRPSQTRKHDVQTSEEISARSLIQSMDQALRVPERTGSSSSSVSDVQGLSAAKCDSVVSSQGSFNFQLRPISANISVRVQRATVAPRILSRQSVDAPSSNCFETSMSVRSLSPTNSKSLTPIGSKETVSEAGVTEEASFSSLDYASTARQAIRTFAEETLRERSRQASPPRSPVQAALSSGGSLTNVDELDKESLRNIRMIYGAGSEVPLPQEPSKQDLRPLDDGLEAQLRLGDVLSSRKVWGKHSAAFERKRENMQASNPSIRKNCSLPANDQPPDLARDAVNEPKGASHKAVDGVFPYPIAAAQYRWQHYPNRLPAEVLARQMRSRQRTTRPRGQMQPVPLGAGPTGYALLANVANHAFDGSLKLHEHYPLSRGIEDSALLRGKERQEEMSAAGKMIEGRSTDLHDFERQDQSGEYAELSDADLHQNSFTQSWSSLSGISDT